MQPDVDKNFGACTGPHCKFFADRCEWGYCKDCCDRIHGPLESAKNHGRPWSDGAVSVGFKVNMLKSDARLPAIYQPKSVVPEPEELVEITDKPEGDYTLGDKHTTVWREDYGY